VSILGETPFCQNCEGSGSLFNEVGENHECTMCQGFGFFPPEQAYEPKQEEELDR